MPLRSGPVSPVPPVVVHRAGQDPALARRRQVARHVRADLGDALRDPRVEVRIDRIEERRHEDPRPLRPHLMHVVVNGREPFVVDQVGQELGLFEVEHEPVAVGVVPGVDVVQLGHPAPLPRVPLRPLVPARDLVTPSGLAEGTSRRIVLSRISRVAGSSRSPARAAAPSPSRSRRSRSNGSSR